ncbi:3-oxoacyl-ACP reductase FabG [Peribacillus cavernae]|uniref:3-oxoacyl-ACP reductase FabG n=1 Tax=Peribacillus cavernae TaxID=1674310 RepID=A0A433HFV8_9BACI|nr:3-oxoacyl-ACP reductase family protein [Peribacillus cavernae]MDQ0219417.1 3-oxoacyl-[acyl-carrier protein] reductase [Peribacillus cavernae]RUQ27155.1 3-oxoacyl-ACP reductase FabG [Peribacillus cavernae]
MVEGKVSIVTGAAMGLGSEIATELANMGSKIVVADMEEEKGLNFVEELQKLGKEALFLKVDVSNEDSVEQMVKRSVDQYGQVDILVNSAGVTQGKAMEDISAEDWDFVLNVNLKGPYLCTKHLMPIMKKQRYGRIINISSIAAMMGGGFVGTSHYASSKAGIIGLTIASAKETAAFGITVNAVAPGPCRTRLSSSWLADHEDEMAKTIPIPKVCEPTDIANAVLFFASERSNYITGQTLAVDGGLTTIGKVVS